VIGGGNTAMGPFHVRVDANSQIRLRADVATLNEVRIATLGYIYRRVKDAT